MASASSSAGGGGGRSSLDARFQAARAYIASSSSATPLSNAVQLKFYKFYKQATEGRCKTQAPSRLRFVARSKWDAWKSLKSMGKDSAKRNYIKELTKAVPDWETKQPQSKL